MKFFVLFLIYTRPQKHIIETHIITPWLSDWFPTAHSPAAVLSLSKITVHALSVVYLRLSELEMRLGCPETKTLASVDSQTPKVPLTARTLQNTQ